MGSWRHKAKPPGSVQQKHMEEIIWLLLLISERTSRLNQQDDFMGQFMCSFPVKGRAEELNLNMEW